MRSLFVSVAALSIMVACSSSSSSGPATQTGLSCKAATDCYVGLDAGALKGPVQCLTQVQNGYCTHTCTTDADCCAVPGECPNGFPEVCGPFESTGQNYCFLSCETVPQNAGTTDPTAYCQKFANPTFTCRSTGGGKTNRQICAP